jgi:hypothetical protein
MNMTKDKLLKTAVIPGAIALAVLLLSFRIPINADSIAGFGTVLALVSIAALEYRLSWKELIGR